MSRMSVTVFCVLAAWSIFVDTIKGNVELDTGVIIQPVPSTVIAVQKNPLLLNCSAISAPEYKPVSYSWYKDGKKIAPDRRVHVKENGSLYFRRVKQWKQRNKTDEGTYECLLSNKEGTVIGRRVDLKIARMAKKFRIEPQSQTAEEGGVAQFVCNIEAVPPPVYMWKKDGKSISQNNKRYTNSSSGVLQIYNLQSSDAGLYHCTAHQFNKLLLASNNLLRHSKDAVLTVNNATGKKSPPVIVASSDEVNAVVDQTVTLECLADGSPRPTITWLKVDSSSADGQSVTPVLEDIHKQRVGDGNLKFNEVSQVDTGTYKCVASSPGFNDTVAVVKLNVNVPPSIEKGPISSIQPIARRIRLPCVIQGEPTPEVTWYYNGRKLIEGGNIKISPRELLIESTLSDSGYFQCIAKNSVGSVMSTARLKITLEENAPKPPQKVTATTMSATQIKLSWQESEFSDCCPVIAYTVHYNEVIGKTIVDFEQRKVTEQNTIIIYDLKPYREYQFYVRAYSTAGASKDSDPVATRTAESLPSAAPQMKLSSSSPKSINVKWNLIPESERNGVITGYKISYRMEGSDIVQEQEVGRDITQFTILGLKAETEYHVQLLAKTSVGYPNLPEKICPWVIQMTASHNHTIFLPTPMLKIEALNKSAVQVQWKVQNSTGYIKGYQLYVRNLIGKSRTKVHHIPKTENTYNLTGLEFRMYYEVVLIVEGRGKTLGIVNKNFQAMDPNTKPEPPPPKEISVSIASPHKIILTWNKPRTTIDIHQYTVRYHKIGNPQNVTDKISDSLTITLDTLEAFTMYSVAVRSETVTSKGIFSNPVEVVTKEDVPSAPESVNLIPIDKGVVELQWSPPLRQNGIIIYYIIQYNNNKSDPDVHWHMIQRNGTVTTAVVRDLKGTVYYFKLRACTRAGQGPPSKIIEIELNKCSFECYQQSLSEGPKSRDNILKDQRLGIIIGCTIGLTCILVCILVILLRQRHYANLYQRSAGLQMANHRAQNGSGESYVFRRDYTLEHLQENNPRIPMLHENKNFDSKGPGSNMVIHKDGKIIYLCSDRFLKGRLPMANSGNQTHEQTALLLLQEDDNKLDTTADIVSNGNQSVSIDNDGNQSLSVDIDGNQSLSVDNDGNQSLSVDNDGNQSLSVDSGTIMTEDAQDSAFDIAEDKTPSQHRTEERNSSDLYSNKSCEVEGHSHSSVADSPCPENVRKQISCSTLNECSEISAGENDTESHGKWPSKNGYHGNCYGDDLLLKMLKATSADIDCYRNVESLQNTSDLSSHKKIDEDGMRSSLSSLPQGQESRS